MVPSSQLSMNLLEQLVLHLEKDHQLDVGIYFVNELLCDIPESKVFSNMWHTLPCSNAKLTSSSQLCYRISEILYESDSPDDSTC